MSKPTIVLVHGAFGDASSWRGVFDLLDGGEYTLLAAALPLRGVAGDAAYLGAVIDQLDGPVVLVGHSYAGCVITVAGVSDKVAGARVRGRIRARRGRVDHRPAGPLPVARDGELPPADGRCPMGASSCRSTPSASTTSSAPTCPTTSPRSWRTHSVRSWPRRSRSRPRLPPGARSRPGPCSEPETSRSRRSCTASRTTGPARR